MKNMSKFPVLTVAVKDGDVRFFMDNGFLEKNPKHTPESVQKLLESTGLVVKQGLLGPLDAVEHMEGYNVFTVTGQSFMDNLYARKETHGRSGVMELLGDTFASKRLLMEAEEKLVLGQIEEVQLKERVTTGIAWRDTALSGLNMLSGVSTLTLFGGSALTSLGTLAAPFTGNVILPLCGLLSMAAGLGGYALVDRAEERVKSSREALREESQRLDAIIDGKKSQLFEHMEARRREFGLG